VKDLTHDDGFSLVEIVVALFVTSLLTLLVLNTTADTTRVSNDIKTQDGAVLLAYQVLQQANALGCGNTIGTEPTGGSQPDSLAASESRCSWYSQYGTSPDWGTTPTSACTTASGAPLQELVDTPWMCAEYGTTIYALQLTQDWTYPNLTLSSGETSPSCSDYSAVATTPAPQLTRTVSIVWSSSGNMHHESWSRTVAAPPGSIYHHPVISGSLCVQTTAPAVAIQVTSSSGTTYDVARVVDSSGAALFPDLIPGSYDVVQWDTATNSWESTGAAQDISNGTVTVLTIS